MLIAFMGLATITVASLAFTSGVSAQSSENPQSKSMGLQGLVSSKPPTQGATITTPTNGQTFTRTPITVSGLCPSGLLVKIFTNNVFVGSVMCANGSYSLQVDLFDGRNDLVAKVFDALDQPGPDSNIVTVTFQNNQFRDNGIPLLTLTSNFARRGADPGKTLTWPIIISGGSAPYAISVDWGDNKPLSLKSESFPGTFDIDHIYDSAGTYSIIVKATDKDGQTAYLQLVAVANGAVTQSGIKDSDGNPIITKTQVLWGPSAAMVPFLGLSFWLGRHYEISVLRKHLEDTE